ncbi:MAG: thioesterase family protein [Alistipes sp.]|nr:thioesterase family protein [Alistipes sp.]MBQ6868989.1 thioesterase family protein [Alistipes sp.]MBQ9963028.1 thioesterase family protein [Alistipes sp.]
MNIGLSFTATTTVNQNNTAKALGSGDMDVFATPAMVALMENAAMTAVAPHLEAGQTTVGTQITTSHIKASALGATISATATLTAVDGRSLTFAITAREGDKVIGEGTHTRFIVDRERFLAKLK